MRKGKSLKTRVWKFYRADGSFDINPSSSLYPFRAMDVGDWFAVAKDECAPDSVRAMARFVGKDMRATFEVCTRLSDGQEYLKVTRVPYRPPGAPKAPPRPPSDVVDRIMALQPGESLQLARGTYDAVEVARTLRTLQDVRMTRSYGVATVIRTPVTKKPRVT